MRLDHCLHRIRGVANFRANGDAGTICSTRRVAIVRIREYGKIGTLSMREKLKAICRRTSRFGSFARANRRSQPMTASLRPFVKSLDSA
jgi:hypothetical protein